MVGEPDKRIDCLGRFCPLPILETREAVRRMAVGQILELIADDPGAEADMRRWSARTGHELLAVDKDGTVLRFLVRKTH
jgi:tRNA 2-thiouridine synthesizing protein A